MALRKLSDTSVANWIGENTDRMVQVSENWKGNFVSHCVPKIYSAYCKIFHSMGEDLSIKDHSLTWDDCKNDLNADEVPKDLIDVRWRDLAEQFGLVFHPEINEESFSRYFKRKIGGWPRYLFGPDEGVIEEADCRQLVQTLSSFTGKQACFFRYELITTDDYVSDLVFAGSLEDIFEVRNVEGVHASPTSWWPEDRSWFVHTDYDLTFTLIGGTREIVESLLSNKALESIEINATHRIDYLADQINP